MRVFDRAVSEIDWWNYWRDSKADKSDACMLWHDRMYI